MPYQTIVLSTAFLGSTISAIWDLKTTEIPDQIPYIMIAVALITYGIQSYAESNYWIVLNSLIVGLSLLGFGFLMYYLGQWGGGDAKLLSALGFLLPAAPSGFASLLGSFPLSLLFNLFLVGSVYMLAYALVLAGMNKKIIERFVSDVKSSSNIFLAGSAVLFIMFVFLNLFISNLFSVQSSAGFLIANSVFPLLATISIFLIWKFAKAVEDVGFRKKIPISKLKIGDVILESKLWEGITEKELNTIKRSGKRFVWVKEGVRFAPAFPLALLFTLYFGDGILLFMKFVS
ncbi:MAG: prepilin peptidase [Candidatus Aenigmarchaeota archaeon]|nr:prepilin peptidase [Candidatus Aenigmarchaeota archaeon]